LTGVQNVELQKRKKSEGKYGQKPLGMALRVTLVAQLKPKYAIKCDMLDSLESLNP
jgi:hypothetical protein